MKKIKRLSGPYIFGPNSQKGLAGRAYYNVYYTDGSRTTILRSRHMMQQHLGRELRTDEHVDHINDDFTDDRIENLQVLSAKDHARKTLTGRESPLKGIEKGWKHGTTYAWQKKKCRCEECFPLWRKWQDQRNERRRSKSTSRGPYNQPAEHGTYKRYKRGCKCPECRRANAEYTRKLKSK